MKFISAAFACLAALAGTATADTPMATNPILWADVPDISIVRVGDTYYMSSTTMHMSPGLPIMKSPDLVNWTLVSYAYDTLADNDPLNLANGKSAYGAGSWASSLRYHNGRFYVSTFSSTSGKTHIYSTRDPEKEPWTETSFKPSLHDHSLWFEDDGRALMIYGGGRLRLAELNSDLTGLKPGDVNQVIIENATKVGGEPQGLNAEGSQLWKVNGKYYLFNITWPRGGMRTEIVHRADALTGPWEGRIVLKDAGIAQGGIVDTPDGQWWAYMFQDHGAVGRIPYLVPMKWEDGWPVMGVDGKAPMTLNLPANTVGLSNVVASDEFDRKPGDRPLPLAWQWNHNPDAAHWSLIDRPGFLRITTGRVDADFLHARNSLTQRTFGPECSGTIALDVTGLHDGDLAGLAALQRKYGLVGVKQEGDTRSIVMTSAESGQAVELAHVPLNQDMVYLRIECDFKDRADQAYFSYSLDGTTFTRVGQPLHMEYTLPHFMGYRFALFNFATKAAGGHADFDWFRIGNTMAR
ncbi:MAG: glycoside hydrolase 43 family protein [Tepidisphaeraceae bacterium]